MARPVSRTTAMATHWITIGTFAMFLTFQSLKTYWFIMVSKLIAWAFSFQLSNQHRNNLTLSHMPVHSRIYSINTRSGLTPCQTGCEMKGHMAAWAMSLTSGGSYSDGEDRRQAQERGTCPPELGLATAQSAEKIKAWFKHGFCPPGARTLQGEANA